jgi:AT-rich interactive domain-containing protein 1
VNKEKKWKEICSIVKISNSASAAFTLKKNYVRYLFAFECKFDGGGVDPEPILAEMEASMDKKRDSKKRAPSPGTHTLLSFTRMLNTEKRRVVEGEGWGH